MQIFQVNNNYNNNFRAIKLSAAEHAKAENIVKKIASSRMSDSVTDNMLWHIFQKHLESEAHYKSNKWYIFKDVFAGLCLRYSESLNDIKNKGFGIDYLINQINNFSPSKDDLKESYLSMSLDAKIPRCEKGTCFAEMITEKNLPVPDDYELAEKASEKVNNLLSKIQLSPKQKRRMNKKLDGLSNAKIAQSEGVCVNVVEYGMLQAKHRIQFQQGVLDQKFIDKALEIKKALNLDVSDEKIIESLVNMPNACYMPVKTIKSNMLKGAELLNCSADLYAKAIVKNLALALMKPETINSNIEKLADLFELPKSKITEMALKMPNYFFQKPETIYNNFQQLKYIFNCSEQELIEAVQKEPNILCLKSGTVKKKITEISEIFNCPYMETAQTVLKNPDSLKYSKEKLSKKKNMKEYYLKITDNNSNKAKIVSTVNQSEECSINGILAYVFTGKKAMTNLEGKKYVEDYIKSLNGEMYEYNIPEGKSAEKVKKYLSELSKKLEGKNIFKLNFVADYSSMITEFCSKFGVSSSEFTKVIEKNPVILYQNTKVTESNINNLKNILDCTEKEAAKIALKCPKLIYWNECKTNEFLNKFAEQFGCTLDEIREKIINSPILLTITPETWQKKNAIKKYYFKVADYKYKNSDFCSTTAIVSDKYYYAGILIKLMLNKIGQCNIDGEKMLREYITTLDKPIYEYNIPEGEIAEDLVKYISDLSKEILNKNVFKFNIVK